MKTILIAAMSADGRIARSEHDLSLEWTSSDDRSFFVRKSRELGAVVMGRKTWETIGEPLKGRLTVVMTRRPMDYTSVPGTLEFTDRSPGKILENLSERGYKGAAIAGGASVYSQFLADGLADELYVTVEPLLFSRGVCLTGEGGPDIRLQLVETSRLGSDTVLLHYRIPRYGD